MSFNSSMKNTFFSPLKIIQNKNSNRSQPNIFTSSERKKKPLEKTNEFLSSTIKKTDEEEYEEILQKRKNIHKKIDDIILLLSQRQKAKKITSEQNQNFTCKENYNFQKYLHMNNKKNKNLEKMKENEILKEKNLYLKNMLKELRLRNKKNDINFNKNNKNNMTYDFLLRQNKELINENNNLNEEYNILKLEYKSATTIENIMENKYEVISKIKTLKYSINNLLNLLTSNNSDTNKKENSSKTNNTKHIFSYNYNDNSFKNHTINKYDFPLKLNEFEKNKLYVNNSNTRNENKKINKDFEIITKNKLNLNSNIIFTEGGNLNTNNNSLYNKNDDSSDNDQIEISLKQFEKSDNTNLNNLIINTGGININNNNYTENTTRQNQNKKIIFTEKRKNTMTINSYSKESTNDIKNSKDSKKKLIEGKSTKNIRENNNNINYNFFNIKNICLDKKVLSDNNKNIKFNGLNNNKTSSKFKIKKKKKKKNKGINDNFRVKKNYKINNGINIFQGLTKTSKKY